MAKKYLTPDFDVTAYEMKDIITAEGDLGFGEDPDGWMSDPFGDSDWE